jgi:cell division protein FtsZ
MTINLTIPDIREMKPRITVFGVGGAGGNAVNNMISAGLQGVDFVVANTDAQALTMSKAERIIQMGTQVTEGLGAGSQPEVGRAAAEEVIDEIRDHLTGAHMVFVTAGMGGGTGTGAAPIVAKTARELGILTVGVITKPFQFEGQRRMRFAEAGIVELQKVVDTLLIIPNQNLFRVANEKTTFADAFAMADQVLYSGVACITDLMVKEDDASMKGARGLLISITGGKDLTLYEVDEAATRIREEVDQDANIIVGATFDETLEGIIRVSVVATGIDNTGLGRQAQPAESALRELAGKIRNDSRRIADRIERTSVTAHAAPSLESAAHAAVAAAILPSTSTSIEDVSIRPMPIKPSLFEPAQSEAPIAEPQMPAAYIPPAPERYARTPRMPRIDELPLPAQNEIRAQRGELEDDHPEKRRMTLMQRLASVGLGRRTEGEAPATAPMPRPARPAPQFERPQQRPTARHPEGRPAEPVSEYARRTAPQGLDPHGRSAPVHNSAEEDQLDIPAFLRRQAN